MSRVLHRTGAIPPVAVRGEGIWLHTADGRAIIDASGGAAVAALGHGNRRVAEAIARQAVDDGLCSHRNVLQPAGRGPGRDICCTTNRAA